MDKMILDDYRSIIEDPTSLHTAEQLVLNFGLRANLKGCKYIVDAVILYGTDTCSQVCEIYRIIGNVRGYNSKTVMRDITYTVKHSFGLAERLSKTFGISIHDDDIHSALVIAYLGRLFKNPNLPR